MTDKPRIRVNYRGQETPEIRAYLDKVEAALNDNVDVEKLIADTEEAHDQVMILGQASIDITELLKKP